MVTRLIALNVVLLLSMLSSSAVLAEIRKRVDEDGQVHYEDAPAGSRGAARQSSTEESKQQPLTPEQERLQKQRRVLEAMETERRAKQQAKDKTERERKEAAAGCEKARRELDRRRNAGFLYHKGKDGEREVLNDADHAKAIADAEAAVKKSCRQ